MLFLGWEGEKSSALKGRIGKFCRKFSLEKLRILFLFLARNNLLHKMHVKCLVALRKLKMLINIDFQSIFSSFCSRFAACLSWESRGKLQQAKNKNLLLPWSSSWFVVVGCYCKFSSTFAVIWRIFTNHSRNVRAMVFPRIFRELIPEQVRERGLAQ